jgi:hypothetical protein
VTPPELVEAYLDEQEILYARGGDGGWSFSLSGEHKKSLPVALEIRESTLALHAFFLRRPLENAAEVYRMLLSRNMRRSPVRFAADADGDVYLVGELPLAGLDEASVDTLLGATLAVADEMFRHALEVGFASYLERDLAWRERAGREG